jgi:hypothetical protein
MGTWWRIAGGSLAHPWARFKRDRIADSTPREGAYAYDFWLLAVMFAAVPLVLPLMRRIRMEPSTAATAPATERAAAYVAEEGAT